MKGINNNDNDNKDNDDDCCVLAFIYITTPYQIVSTETIRLGLVFHNYFYKYTEYLET